MEGGDFDYRVSSAGFETLAQVVATLKHRYIIQFVSVIEVALYTIGSVEVIFNSLILHDRNQQEHVEVDTTELLFMHLLFTGMIFLPKIILSICLFITTTKSSVSEIN